MPQDRSECDVCVATVCLLQVSKGSQLKISLIRRMNSWVRCTATVWSWIRTQTSGFVATAADHNLMFFLYLFSLSVVGHSYVANQ